MATSDQHIKEYERIRQAFDLLRQCTFPPNYLDGVYNSLLGMHVEAVDPGHRTRRYCYLAFFGDGDRAVNLKVGISKDVSFRMKTFATGNPMQNLWTFVVKLPDILEAGKVERFILAARKDWALRGEWLRVDVTGEDAARSLAQQLVREAQSVTTEPLVVTKH